MLSVIIPTLNEEKALPETLGTLFEQTTDEEVIVVDGGSTDDTKNICAQFPAITFISSKKGRAAQLNTGARAAHGDILLFLHADTLLPEHALCDIKQQIIQRNRKAGGFNHRY